MVKKTVRGDLEEMLEARSRGGAARRRWGSGDTDGHCAAARRPSFRPVRRRGAAGGAGQGAALRAAGCCYSMSTTKGLDAFFKDKLARLLRSLTARGTTVLMVSHDVEFCASYADWCALFFDGNVVTTNPPLAVLRFEQLLYHSSQSHKPGLLRKCGYRGGGGGAMPKLTEGARSAEAFRERRRARVKTILTILCGAWCSRR